MAKVLFISFSYADFGVLPSAPAIFSAILKGAGHEVRLFDTSFYPEISKSDYQEKKESLGMTRSFDDTKVKSIKKMTKKQQRKI